MHDAAGIATRRPLPKTIRIDQRDRVPIVENGVGRLNADDTCADNCDVHVLLDAPGTDDARNEYTKSARLAIDGSNSAYDASMSE